MPMTKKEKQALDDMHLQRDHARALGWRDYYPVPKAQTPTPGSCYTGYVPMIMRAHGNAVISLHIMHAATTESQHVTSHDAKMVEAWAKVQRGSASKADMARCPTASREPKALYIEWGDALRAGRLMLQQVCAEALARVDADIEASDSVDADHKG